jgi:hypothetical protein
MKLYSLGIRLLEVITEEEMQEEAVTFSRRQVVDSMNDVLVKVSTALVMICEVDKDEPVEALKTVWVGVGAQAISDYGGRTADSPLLERRNEDVEANDSIAALRRRTNGWAMSRSTPNWGVSLCGHLDKSKTCYLATSFVIQIYATLALGTFEKEIV